MEKKKKKKETHSFERKAARKGNTRRFWEPRKGQGGVRGAKKKKEKGGHGPRGGDEGSPKPRLALYRQR